MVDEASANRQESGLLSFDPPHDAEPQNGGTENHAERATGEAEVPTVLTKLQKWADYPSVGTGVNPTRFLPMKTPMSQEIVSNWSLPDPPKHSLTVPELLASQAAAGRTVGMIIDLANHECLYAEDVPDSLEYCHIQLVAKVLPPVEAIDDVQAAAQEFWARRPGDYIAIHCAYGFNRTGFVVCSFLCQACGMTVEAALESFAAARPPGVKHGKFVDELYARYGNDRGPPKDPEPLQQEQQRLRSSGSFRREQEAAVAATGKRRGSSGMLSSALARASSAERPASEAAGDPPLCPPSPALSNRHSLRGGSPEDAPSPASSSTPIPAPSRRHSSRSLMGGSSGHSGSVVVGSIGADGGSFIGACGSAVEGTGGSGRARELSAMAQHLEGKSLMRKETSLGLARALHEDFGGHEHSTPGRQGDPSPLMALTAADDWVDRAENATEEEDRQERSREASGNPPSPEETGAAAEEAAELPKIAPGADAGASTETAAHPRGGLPKPPLLRQVSPYGGEPSCIAVADSGWIPGAFHAAAAASQRSPGRGSMPRNCSFDSDNQSLGFNAREALATMARRDRGKEREKPSTRDMHHCSAMSDMDLSAWDANGDLISGAGEPTAEGRKAAPAATAKKERRVRNPRSSWNICAVM